MKSNILKNLAVNLLIVIISLLATSLSFVTLDIKIVKKLCILLIILLSAIVILIYFYSAISELKEQYKVKKEQETLQQVLPHLLCFSKRKDYFTILPNGDGELLWSFHIIKEAEEPLQFLYFPVSFERQKDDFDFKNVYVEVIRSTLDGKKCLANYNVKSVSHEIELPIESGYIEVPVLLDMGKKEFDLEISIKIKGLFKNFAIKEFVFVDIPYVTEELEVKVNASSGYNINIINPFFEASEECSQNSDSAEMSRQMSKCDIISNRIQWKTQYPKLGYHYKIQFRVTDEIT